MTSITPFLLSAWIRTLSALFGSKLTLTWNLMKDENIVANNIVYSAIASVRIMDLTTTLQLCTQAGLISHRWAGTMRLVASHVNTGSLVVNKSTEPLNGHFWRSCQGGCLGC